MGEGEDSVPSTRYDFRSIARRLGAAAALAVVVLSVSACPKRGGPPTGGGPGADGAFGTGMGGAGGIDDGTMAPGSSLSRARRGLPPEEDGVLKDVHFDLDSYTLGPEARSLLERNAQWLKANPRTNVEIEGHADQRGTIEYNLALGARRAQAARDYLVVLGIAAGRSSTISYGEELPLCRDPSDECLRRNRRVHFVVLSP